MQHLPIERMAELVDGGASPEEREHLTACAGCSRELEAYRRVTAMASDERRRIAPPLTDWDSLSERLRAEGLVASGGERSVSERSLSGRSVSGRTAAGRRMWQGGIDLLRRAAVVVVFLGGGAVLGRMSAGMPITEAVAIGPESVRLVGSGAGVLTGEEGAPTQPASSAAVGFRTTEEALRALEVAQRQYEVAASWLASHDTSSSEFAPAQYRTRLAALDRTAETMQQAMREAPSDPYINQYYLATLSAREQTLRRLGTTLPVGSRLGRF